jgi:predicted nucleotidyltransferase component of viral defense system
MDILRQHEIFEIEVLDRLKSLKMLDNLVFGGGTMLRLCHGLNRYSVDLDFWFIKETQQDVYFDAVKKALEKRYEITDAQIKHFTLLFELRASAFPKRLKIEIRREVKECDYQEMIAFSPFSTKQVALKAHTLEQAMNNKIAAFFDRGEIRDCFDIEFLLRRGVKLPPFTKVKLRQFQKKIRLFKDNDFKVKLGSIVDSDAREYYNANRFSFLDKNLTAILLK